MAERFRPSATTVDTTVRHMFGWVPDRPDHRDQLFKPSVFKTLLLPRKVELRDFFPRVEHQGGLGSCTSHASTSAVEFLYRRLRLEQPEFSRLFLYYATRVWVAGDQPTEDSGASIRNAMKALAKYGVCKETFWPYNLSKWTQEPDSQAKTQAEKHQILRYFRCPSLRYIKLSLSEGFPVVGGFSVPESIDGDDTVLTGIVKYPGVKENLIGGHAVLFSGYDDSRRLLTFQNSWGKNWGDDGYGYLPYEYVEHWLANDFWTVRLSEI